MSELACEVAECRSCPRLVAWREQVATERRAAYADWEYWGRGVPGFGDPAADIMVIGLAPAAHGANRTGRMFTGDRSGDWLYRGLYRAGLANQASSVDVEDGLELNGAFVTSPVKCAPPANKPTPLERDTCRPFLDRELETVDPAVLVALGGFAYQVLCQYFSIRPRPKFGHGVEVPVPDTIAPKSGDPESGDPEATVHSAGGRRRVILCSYHVSQQNTFTGRLTEEMLDAVFARAVTLAAELR